MTTTEVAARIEARVSNCAIGPACASFILPVHEDHSVELRYVAYVIGAEKHDGTTLDDALLELERSVIKEIAKLEEQHPCVFLFWRHPDKIRIATDNDEYCKVFTRIALLPQLKEEKEDEPE